LQKLPLCCILLGMEPKLDPALPISGHSGDETPAQSRYTPKPPGSWRKLVGRTKEDELSPEAFRLGAEWRARMNRRGK
jgi:hypothetical protein